MFSLLRMSRKRDPSQLRTSRRRKGSESMGQDTAQRLTFGRLTIDRLRHEVTVLGHPIHLTPREFDLLWALGLHPGRVYRREELLTQVWGNGVFVSARTVDVHMAKLRHKLRTSDEPSDFVETIWGVGYRLRSGSL